MTYTEDEYNKALTDAASALQAEKQAGADAITAMQTRLADADAANKEAVKAARQSGADALAELQKRFDDLKVDRDSLAAQLAAVTSERDSLNGLRDEDHARSVGYVETAKEHLQALVTVLTEASMTTETLKAAKEAAEKARIKAELEAKLAAL